MKYITNKNIGGRLFKRVLSVLNKEVEAVSQNDPAEKIKNELDGLWKMKAEKADVIHVEDELREKIEDSFKAVKGRFSGEQLDMLFTWPRYVRTAVHFVNEPIDELINYVNGGNYKSLTSQLSNLSQSIRRGEDEKAKDNIEKFSIAVYTRILKDINDNDVPSILALGRIFQRRGEFDTARGWFEEAIETEEPFNGVTAILACYECETKAVLSRIKSANRNDFRLREKVQKLNECQHTIYEKWCGIITENINNSDEDVEQRKREYVVLMTGYARFERSRGDYEKALELLYRIPRTFPEIYRAYTEEAMIYQIKSYKNNFYSLENAIEMFKRAEDVLLYEGTPKSTAKSQKSILMPMANAYFQLGLLDEAKSICEKILKIDAKEFRAVNLKNKIVCMSA